MSFDVDWRRVNRPVYTEYKDVHVLQGDSQAQLGSNFPLPKGNVVDVDCGTNVVGEPMLFSSRTSTPRCWMFPEFGSGHPWKSRILKRTMLKEPERPCLDTGIRLPGLLIHRAWPSLCRRILKSDSGHSQRARISQVT